MARVGGKYHINQAKQNNSERGATMTTQEKQQVLKKLTQEEWLWERCCSMRRTTIIAVRKGQRVTNNMRVVVCKEQRGSCNVRGITHEL